MPVIYSKAAEPALDLLADTIARYHAELAENGVTVGVLVAHPGDDGEPPVKLHGYPCAAVIKITPYKQRVQGIEDAVITLSGPHWRGLDEAGRVALLDHELEHLELSRDREGNVRSDDQGRPKLKLRLHDWQLGGFESIAKRHGPAAPEVTAYRAAHERYYQCLFAWSDDMAEEPVEIDNVEFANSIARKAAGVPVVPPAAATARFPTSEP